MFSDATHLEEINYLYQYYSAFIPKLLAGEVTGSFYNIKV